MAEEDFVLITPMESIIALNALYSVIYISICFKQQKFQIKTLVKNLQIFEQFSNESLILKTEKGIEFYTKFFILYGILGNVCYAMFPLVTYNKCMENRSYYMRKNGISCGVIARYLLPFKYDLSPYFIIVIIEQALVCSLATTIVMMITMLVCGILTHLSVNLESLKGMILDLSNFEGSDLEVKLKFCVKYHTAIIDFSDRTNMAFGMMMLVHIGWTSIIISVLGFEIIMQTDYTNSLRYAMHLAGWLGMLYIICYYGQTLINKSIDISKAAYNTNWYEKPGKIRESISLILLRSQRPLALKAAKLQMMSLSTFLGVLSTAYSYFTLLLKLKN